MNLSGPFLIALVFLLLKLRKRRKEGRPVKFSNLREFWKEAIEIDFDALWKKLCGGMKIEQNEGYDHRLKTNIPKIVRVKESLMNTSTRRIIFIVVFVGIMIMITMGLWPPFKEIYSGGIGTINVHREKLAGYYFILKPPVPENVFLSFTIDFSRLLIQWFLLILIVGFIVWMLKWFEKGTIFTGKDSSAHGHEVESHSVRLMDFLKGQGLTLNNMMTLIKVIALAREAGYIPEGKSFIELLKQDIRAHLNDPSAEPVYPYRRKL